MNLNRRHFLRGVSASTLTAASMASVGTALSGFKAHAADTSGYKALVCVFLTGGMDNYDTIIPYDTASYDRWATIRQTMLPGFSTSRTRSNLLPLSPTNADSFPGREFALPPEMSGIGGLFESGRAAIVGNVGPLIQSVDRASFLGQTAMVPPRLFSHNDQQSVWMANSPEGAQFGWGGLFADAASSGNGAPEFTSMTTGEFDLFGTGQAVSPFQFQLNGSTDIQFLTEFGAERNGFARLVEHFRGRNSSGANLLERDIADKLRDSYDSNNRFAAAIQSASALTTAFPETGLGDQLQAVARAIAARSSLSASRQVFIVEHGGFDTHSEQARNIPELQSTLDSAVVAFSQAMDELGVGSDVTLFTASDFGRSLAVNGDGTDHGWGGHHFVVGGAVQGHQIYGDLPIADFGHSLDAGGGRLIPTVSVDQYAAPLGRWFGLTTGELSSALPNLVNFPAPELRFV